ncbi:MAG: tryptophan synthase subunit alpha [Vicinamibacterales bacterium]|jgi:tryptophan synthase alpha chain|nr:tryptophan synthase subunit alpha [Vicinamibacterales bacterium]
MSRLADAFAAMRRDGRTGLVTYVTAGDPDLARTARVLRALDEGGVDVIEVGVPFSDPLADGPVIQRAAERALRAGTTLSGVLDLVARERAHLRPAIVLFTYANPVLRLGLDAFAERAAAAGVDGVLVLDLPLEEAGPLHRSLEAAGLDTIFLLSPTTTAERIGLADHMGRGFLYVISRLGVTGVRDQVADGLAQLTARIRAHSTLPIALGFGLSRPEHVRQVGLVADAAVVGSALVDRVAAWADAPDLEARVTAFVRWLRSDGPPPEGA